MTEVVNELVTTTVPLDWRYLRTGLSRMNRSVAFVTEIVRSGLYDVAPGAFDRLEASSITTEFAAEGRLGRAGVSFSSTSPSLVTSTRASSR